jgi:hypothetical protein
MTGVVKAQVTAPGKQADDALDALREHVTVTETDAHTYDVVLATPGITSPDAGVDFVVDLLDREVPSWRSVLMLAG